MAASTIATTSPTDPIRTMTLGYLFSLLVVALVTRTHVEAFSPPMRCRLSTAQSASRRVFVESAVLALLPTVAVVSSAVALDDMAMPTSDDVKKVDEDEAMRIRLAKKAELQKKAAQPRSFTESLKGELDKQGEMKKQTKEERRNALCEELGRGC